MNEIDNTRPENTERLETVDSCETTTIRPDAESTQSRKRLAVEVFEVLVWLGHEPKNAGAHCSHQLESHGNLVMK